MSTYLIKKMNRMQIPKPCRHCRNYPVNGGDGVCCCSLVTWDMLPLINWDGVDDFIELYNDSIPTHINTDSAKRLFNWRRDNK